MKCDDDTLRLEVSKFLGWGSGPWTATQLRTIDRIVADGKEVFFNPQNWNMDFLGGLTPPKEVAS